jgi:hypothetical protein
MPQKRTSPAAAIVTALVLLCSGSAIASDNKITNIKVDGDIVHFSTSQAKVHTLPNCVATGNAQQWTLSLTSAAGKASYTLLVAAMTDNRSVVVTSANDCADTTGYERAQSIEVGDPIANITRGSSGQLSLYKWDGVTKVGPIFEIDRSTNPVTYWFLESEGDKALTAVQPDKIVHPDHLYYMQKDCKGEPFMTSGNFNPFYNNGHFLKKVGNRIVTTVASYRATSGVCVNQSLHNWYYRIELETTPDPICGFGPCKIKSR